MKVISQLLEYFVERGALSPLQLEALAKQGLYERAETAPAAATTEGALDRVWEQTPGPKPGRKGKGKRGRPKTAALEHADLAAWIAQSIPKWEPALQALRRIANAATLDKAAVAIRNSEPANLGAVLLEAMKRRDPAFNILWTAIEFDRYREILEFPAPGAKGPAAAAYRALLQGGPAVKGSKYAWLLKDPRVRWVYNLAQAQRHLLTILGRLYEEQPEALGRALARDDHPVAYTVFVLLYNARRLSQPEEIVTNVRAHSSPVQALALNRGGSTLFSSGAEDCAFSAWDVRSGKLAHRTATGRSVTGLAISPDGLRLAVSTEGGDLQLHELLPGDIPGPASKAGSGYESDPAFDEDGLLAARFHDAGVSVWDPAAGEQRHRFWTVLPNCASVSFQEGGNILIAAGDDGTTQLIDPSSGKGAFPIPFNHPPPRLAFHPDRRQAAVLDEEAVAIYDFHLFRILRTSLPFPDAADHILTYHPDGEWLAAAGHSRVLLLHPATNEVWTFGENSAPPDPVRLRFTPDKKKLVCAGKTGGVVVCNLESRTVERRWKVDGEQLLEIAIHPHAPLVAIGSSLGVAIWDYEACRRILEFPRSTGSVRALCFNPQGTLLASGSGGGELKLWDTADWDGRHFGWQPLAAVTCLAFHPNGKFLASGGGSAAGGTLGYWDLATRQAIWWVAGHAGRIQAMAADRDRVFTASGTAAAAWDLTKPDFAWSEFRTGGYLSLAICGGGRLLAAGNAWGDIELLDAATGAGTIALSGHAKPVKILKAGKNNLLISADEGGEVRIWDVSRGKCTETLSCGCAIRSMAVSGDGGTIAAGGEDGIVRIFSSEHRRPGPNEAIPQRPLPDWDDWRRAWALALVMNPARVSRLLSYLTENMDGCFSPSPGGPSSYAELALCCPGTWNIW